MKSSDRVNAKAASVLQAAVICLVGAALMAQPRPAQARKRGDSARQTMAVLDLSPRETPKPISQGIITDLENEMNKQAGFLRFIPMEDMVTILGLTTIPSEISAQFESASIFLNDGVQAYDRVNFEQTVEVLNMAEPKLLLCRGYMDVETSLWKLYIYRGMARLALGEEEAAAGDFRLAVMLDPAKSLDATIYDPDTITFYQGIQNEMRAIPVSTLNVVPGQKDAKVFLDGRLLGSGTMTGVEVLPGKHWISVQKAGYLTHRQEIDVPESETLSLEVPLTYQPNLMAVDSLRNKIKERAPARDLSMLANELGRQLNTDYLLAVSIQPQAGKDSYYVSAYSFNINERGQLSGQESGSVVPNTSQAEQTIKFMAQNLIPYYEVEISEELLELKRERRNQALWWAVGGGVCVAAGLYFDYETEKAGENYDDLVDEYNDYIHSSGLLDPDEIEKYKEDIEDKEDQEKELKDLANIGYGMAGGFFAVSLYYGISSMTVRTTGPGRIALADDLYLDLDMKYLDADPGWMVRFTWEH